MNRRAMTIIKIYSTPTKSSLPWTTRRMGSERYPSRTSNLSRQKPAWFEWESTSSSACKKMGAQEPPLSATILLLRGSARSVPQTSSRYSGPRPLELEQPDSDFLQKMSERTIYSGGAMAMHIKALMGITG